MKMLELYRDIQDKTMTPAKKASAKQDYFAFYIGRPLSYWLTIPFLKTKLTPNQVTLLSIIPIFIGFILMCITDSKFTLIIAWLMFFLWNLLDGVDGNLARYRIQFSDKGSVIDAMAGYAAMSLTFFAVGIAASHTNNVLGLHPSWYIIMGGLSSISLIFPRLIMHKYINSVGKNSAAENVKNKSEFNSMKILALNLTSITGMSQVFILLAIIFNLLDILTIGYFIINIVLMFASLYLLLKD